MQRAEQNGRKRSAAGLPQIGHGFAARALALVFLESSAIAAAYMNYKSYAPVAAALSQPKRIGKPSPPSSVVVSYSGRPTTLV